VTTVERTPRKRIQSGLSRVHAGARLRGEAPGAGAETESASASALADRRRRAVAWAAERGGRLGSCAPYTDRPPALADVVAYVRAGGFVPGQHPWWVEAPGYVYGALVAVPATALGYSLMWIVQRPTRLLCVLFVLALLFAAW
jgi:hypothetical protein